MKEKTTEKLKGELGGIKMFTGALIGVLSILILINFYGLIYQDNPSIFIAGIAVVFSLCAIFPLQFSTMKRIKTELKSRENIN